MIDDASIDTKYDNFAKRDGPTDRRSDRHTGLSGCDGRIQKLKAKAFPDFMIDFGNSSSLYENQSYVRR